MRRLFTALAVLLALSIPGCAHKIYVVGANGPDFEQEIATGSTLCVARSPDSEEQTFDDQVKKKVEALAEFKGYSNAASSEAEYFLFYDYKIKALKTIARFQPHSGTKSGISTVKREGPFTHTLSLRLVNGDVYRDGEVEEVVWQGGAVFHDVPTQGSKFHDMLLVAAFELFPEDSSETLKVKLTRGDVRTKQLRASVPIDQ
jgi:hypothetical protein